MEKLGCLNCETMAPLDVFNTFCSKCRDPLLCQYPTAKRQIYFEKLNPLEKFLDFLPLDAIDPSLALGEGNTPLLQLKRIGNDLGYPYLYAKNEGHNPTGSFKDRGTAVAIQKAVSLNIRHIGTVSTGNMASSTAAYGARAGLKPIVLVKEDITEEKLLTTGIFGPVTIKVEGDYGALMSLSSRIGKRHGIFFMNSVDPFRIEGYKVIGLEVFMQLWSNPPEHILAPVSSGGHLIGLIRAFLDLKEAGFIKRIPRFVGVQARGCAPIVAAFTGGKKNVRRIEKARTIAQAITNPDPPGGSLLLKLLREHNGLMIDVADKEILEAQQMLAHEEGLFCQPASATVLAGFVKLAQKNSLDSKDRIVLIITGTGLKSLKILDSRDMNLHHATLFGLEKIVTGALE